MKFKVGDKVKFTRDSLGTGNKMKKGETGIITKSDGDDDGIVDLESIPDKKFGRINVNGLIYAKDLTMRELLE